MTNKPREIKTFRNLEVWKYSRELRIQIGIVVRSFPDSEKYRLVDQLLRASRSVTANIAEGYGRFHYQENIQFTRIARGSLYELLDHLTVAQDCGYINAQKFQSLESEMITCTKLVNGYIGYLKRSKSYSTNN